MQRFPRPPRSTAMRNSAWTATFFLAFLLIASLTRPSLGGDLVPVDIKDLYSQSHDDGAEGQSILRALYESTLDDEAIAFYYDTSPLRQATLLQPTPLLEPRVAANTSAPASTSANSLSSRLFATPGIEQSFLRQTKSGVDTLAVDLVPGSAATARVTTDVGDLLRKSPSALSVEVQRRTPIINDPRVRSSRIGALAASGSYWVPARADLDTALSKIDSRIVDEVLIIPGPYSSLYGPAFHFVDFQLLKSPRSESGIVWNGQTSADFNSNGDQWLGRQGFSGGGEDWGMRVNYTQRGGSDYTTGAGNTVASSYESSEWTMALGRDFGQGRSLEFSLLRLDQYDVEFPGYVFDIDRLITNAYEVTYTDEESIFADRSETEVWYNNTEFTGNAQSPSKRQQFPLLDEVAYNGVTDVKSMSTGYRQGHSWSVPNDFQFTVGHDLRYIGQQLDEIANALTLGLPIPLINRNSPIPQSFSVNPGLFAEYREELLRATTFRTGARVDFVQTDVTDSPARIGEIGLAQFPATYEEIVGTDQTQTDRFLWSLYAAIDQEWTDTLSGTTSIGFAQRPPSLTSLYAAQPFLLLLQNGLNNVTGDPTLDEEKLIQADMSLDYQDRDFKAGLRGFMSFYLDYITFENTNVVRGPPNGDVQQVSLRYVNTDLATFVGGEAFAELFPQSRLTPFVTARGVDGRDRTRNGDFATTNGESGDASEKVEGLSRGFFSGITGSDSEPLPGIAPFETRVGVRYQNDPQTPRFNLELSARIVDNQDRIATSLLEIPTPGFTTWDLRSTFRPARMEGLTLVSGIENMFDKAYREHLDNRIIINGNQFLQPGFNFYVGMDWQY